MPKAKPKFVRLTVTRTYYGVGRTTEEAKQNALNDFANDFELRDFNDLASQDSEQTFEVVKQENTPISKEFVDFVMGNDYEEHDAVKLLKGGK